MHEPSLSPYDCVMLLSFGGPETPAEVVPFLRSVTGGRGIPEERLRVVGEHYFARGGRSPINDESRALLAALEDALERRGLDVPVLWANRHLSPSLADALAQARTSGLNRILCVLTSAYSSYSGCRQYREELAAALAGTSTDMEANAGADADAAESDGGRMTVDLVGPYAERDGFVETMTRLTVAAVRSVLADALAADAALTDDAIRLVYVTHSLPIAQDEASGPPGDGGRLYTRQHERVATRVTDGVAEAVGHHLAHDLVFCSRSGPPTQPWLQPDVNDHLRALAASGVRAVVAIPIGFTSDHMEVVHDLDTEAAATAAGLGLTWSRVSTVRDDARFVESLVDLLVERADQARSFRDDGARSGYACAAGCCPNPRGPRPAVCELRSDP